MFYFIGTIIRPNTKTQYWYIQRVRTLWDPILFTIYIDINPLNAKLNPICWHY